MKYLIWDKTSPVNGVEAFKFMRMMGYAIDDPVYIIFDNQDRAWITQSFSNSPYQGKTIEEKAKAHLNDLENGMKQIFPIINGGRTIG